MRGSVFLLTIPVCLFAADWPRFGGPNGDFHLPEATLRWPEGGPKKVWQRALGEGYSGVVNEGPTLYTMYRRGAQEVAIAMEAETGKAIWEFAYDAPLPADFDVSNTTGPRATPLISGDVLYIAGAGGKFHCLDRKTGKPRWSHDLIGEFGGELRHNGYSASPLAWKDTVIVFPWAPGAAIMALRKSDGAVAWKQHSFVVSYSSPMLIQVGGRNQILMQFSDEVTGLDPSNGNLLWKFPHTNNEKVNVALPVWRGDGLMFLSSGYGTGGRLLSLTQDGDTTRVEQVWTQPIVRVHHSDMVRIGDLLLAASGDMGPCPLTATDVKTGKLLWRDRTFPKASLVAVGKQLLILDEEGVLGLATPTETGLTVHGKMAVLENNSWTPPTVVGTRVYVRDRKNLAAYLFE
jgi:outer membrane protein assembly factor BamB